MKLIKINTDHYVIVDDSEIKQDDFCIYNTGEIIHYLVKVNTDNLKKITHSTQPLDERGYWGKIMPLTLTIPEIKELIGEVDVEKKANEAFPIGTWSSDAVALGFDMYKIGYNQALEDNKDKKYTETDIKNAIIRAYSMMGNTIDVGYFNEVIQSLQPKTEWEVEFDENGKLKLV